MVKSGQAIRPNESLGDLVFLDALMDNSTNERIRYTVAQGPFHGPTNRIVEEPVILGLYQVPDDLRQWIV